MRWQVKSAVLKVLSAMPFGTHAHFILQKHVTKTWPRKPAGLDALIEKANSFIGDFQEHSALDIADATFLELGAGRDLTVPLALRSLGVGRVISTDVERLARIELVQHAARHISKTLGAPLIDC